MVVTVLAVLVGSALTRLLEVEASARAAALAGVRGGFHSAVQLVHLKWRAQGAPGATRVLLDGGGAVFVGVSGWPSLDPVHPEQDSAEELHAALLGSGLGPGWAARTSPLRGGRACFVLPGLGGGWFWYDAATGRVSPVEAQDSEAPSRVSKYCNLTFIL